MCKLLNSIGSLGVTYIAILLSAGLVEAGEVTTTPQPAFTTTDASKDNVLSQASPTFTADLSTFGTFTSQVHSFIGDMFDHEGGLVDFEHQDDSSPDQIHGDIALPYAMVGRSADGQTGSVVYKFAIENGFETAAGGMITADMYFRHDPDDSNHGENAWIGVNNSLGISEELVLIENAVDFTRVTMKQMFSPGHGYDTYTGTANLDIPEGVTEFYVAFSDNYLPSEPGPTHSSARLAITSLSVNANLAVAPIPGDFDGDLQVQGLDLAQWQEDYGINGDSDADRDGDTDGADFLAWQRNFGVGVPELSATAQVVPEPGVFSIVGMAVMMIGISRRTQWK